MAKKRVDRPTESDILNRVPPPNFVSNDLFLSVTGYKAIGDPITLRIAPLTILAGSNSAGKSSFMQPFLLLKQTIDSSFDPGPLLLHGPNVKLTFAGQALSRTKSRTSQEASFSVGLATGSHARELTFATADDGFRIAVDTSVFQGESLTLNDTMSTEAIMELSDHFNGVGANFLQRVAENPEVPAAELGFMFEPHRNRCFLDVGLSLGVGGERRTALGIPLIDRFTETWSNAIRGIVHVPGLRGNPERQYPRSAVGETYIGTFDTYVASIILEWTLRSPSRVQALAADLESLGLTWKVHARKVNDAAVELLVGRMPHAQQGGAQDMVSVADVGFGVSQALPVLVALLAAKPGQIVYLEQPELHLHPRAQLALARPLAVAARRGVKVVLETHSSLLLRAVQTLIANGQVASNSVSMNWFSRDPESGFATLSEAVLDAQGRFGEWPLDFDEIAQDADLAYLDAIRDSRR